MGKGRGVRSRRLRRRLFCGVRVRSSPSRSHTPSLWATPSASAAAGGSCWGAATTAGTTAGNSLLLTRCPPHSFTAFAGRCWWLSLLPNFGWPAANYLARLLIRGPNTYCHACSPCTALAGPSTACLWLSRSIHPSIHPIRGEPGAPPTALSCVMLPSVRTLHRALLPNWIIPTRRALGRRPQLRTSAPSPPPPAQGKDECSSKSKPQLETPAQRDTI